MFIPIYKEVIKPSLVSPQKVLGRYYPPKKIRMVLSSKTSTLCCRARTSSRGATGRVLPQKVIQDIGGLTIETDLRSAPHLFELIDGSRAG